MRPVEHMRSTILTPPTMPNTMPNFGGADIVAPLAVPHGIALIHDKLDRLQELTTTLSARLEPLLLNANSKNEGQPQPSPVCPLHASLLGVEERIFATNRTLADLVERLQI